MNGFCEKCSEQLDGKTGLCPQCDKVSIVHKKQRQKCVKVIIALLCCVSIIVAGALCALKFNNKDIVSDTYGNYISLMDGFSNILITDEKTAIEAVATVSNILGIDNTEKELKVSSVNTIDGDSYYRMQQYYNDIPVYGRSIAVSADADGNATALTSNFSVIADNIDLNPTATQEQINQAINECLDTENTDIQEINDDRIVIYNLGDIEKPLLAYNLTVSTDENIYSIIVDAKTGAVKNCDALLDSETATVYSNGKNVCADGWKNDDGSYHLYNDKYNISIFDFKKVHKDQDNVTLDFTEYGVDTIYSQANEFDEDAVSLLKNLIQVNDYYNELGFDGFYRTHACLNDKSWYNNAAGGSANNDNNQKCAIMYIGEGEDTSSLDLIGHEFSHAVTRCIIGWNCEEAGLNEGFSDIFGELYEYFINRKTDWVHGSRVIKNPSENNYPQNINDENKSGEDDAHGYSTVISHAAYLMWNGINGNEKMKIDCDTLAKLWYRALFLMQSDSTFSQCANAVTLTATHMIRRNELSPKQLKCVLEAFEEVGIQNANNYPKLQSGAKLYVNDLHLNLYDNYHLIVTEIPSIEEMLDKNQGKTVIDTDVNDASGYELNLDPGKYLIQVRDNEKDGSAEEFTTSIEIVKSTIRNKYYLAVKNITIYTDFGKEITAMTDYIGMSLNEIAKIYGEDYTISDRMDPLSGGNDRCMYYEDNRIPFKFFVYDQKFYDSSVKPDGSEMITEIRVSNLPSSFYTIDGNLYPDITYSELRNTVEGNLYEEIENYSYFFEYDFNNQITVLFKYIEGYPNDTSISNEIIVTANFGRGSNVCYQLYEPIIDVYQRDCHNSHGQDCIGEYECRFCSWALYDIDNDGIKELIVQEGQSENSRIHHIYTVRNDVLIELGKYNAWHLALYDDSGKLIGVDGMSGEGNIYNITITEDDVKQDFIKTFNNGFPSYPNPIQFYGITDLGTLYALCADSLN